LLAPCLNEAPLKRIRYTPLTFSVRPPLLCVGKIAKKNDIFEHGLDKYLQKLLKNVKLYNYSIELISKRKIAKNVGFLSTYMIY